MFDARVDGRESHERQHSAKVVLPTHSHSRRGLQNWKSSRGVVTNCVDTQPRCLVAMAGGASLERWTWSGDRSDCSRAEQLGLSLKDDVYFAPGHL